jgi:hypothetical protein
MKREMILVVQDMKEREVEGISRMTKEVPKKSNQT